MSHLDRYEDGLDEKSIRSQVDAIVQRFGMQSITDEEFCAGLHAWTQRQSVSEAEIARHLPEGVSLSSATAYELGAARTAAADAKRGRPLTTPELVLHFAVVLVMAERE